MSQLIDKAYYYSVNADKQDLEEINKIAEMLNPNEEVFVVARQSRLKPGGSKFTPNVVFATKCHLIYNLWKVSV